MEAYVDDVVIKSRVKEDLIADLSETFASLRRFGWKLNPEKCVFGVPSGKLLGFIMSQHGIEAIFIDYLQLLRSTSRRAQDNRQIEIAEISSGLKGLAKELDVPVVVLAQLNRNPETRSGETRGRPRLSDLRESGSIEQDADLVGLLVREEYYADSEEEKKEAEGKATLIIAKQRNGPVGDVPLTFLKEYTRFETRGRTAGDRD